MMTLPSAHGNHVFSEPAFVRLGRLATFGQPALDALRAACDLSFTAPARSEVIAEGDEILRPLLILDGWAARVRLLEDGRRQILSLLLPGDVIGHCWHTRPLAISTVIALTGLKLCPVPAVDALRDLREAFAVSHAFEEAYVLANIMRLGRLTAYERICDLLLEWHERLSLADLVHDDSFTVPLTQEMLADATGLTSVHVNRTLQQLRREGAIGWKGRQVRLTDPKRMADQIGRNPVRVSGAKTRGSVSQ
jgi:CRP-like cAMP-binding protein